MSLEAAVEEYLFDEKRYAEQDIATASKYPHTFVPASSQSYFPSLINDPYWGCSYSTTGLQTSSKSLGRVQETTHIFPSITINNEVNTTYGGESLTITQSSSDKPTLLFTLPNNKKIPVLVKKDALEALNCIHVDNYKFLKDILIEHNLFSNSLNHLKEHDASVNNLYKQIKKLHEHASSLKDLDPIRSKAALILANDLENKADTFFSSHLDSEPSKEIALKFINEFKQLISQKDPLLCKHRAIWKPICANILLALTGIGLLFMAAKAWNHADCAQKPFFNRFFFFGHTQLEEEAEKVNQYATAAIHSCSFK